MKLQRRLYELILQLHPEAFRSEFASEMVHDFDDAVMIYGLSELYFDAFGSLVRQWTVCSYPAAIARRASPCPSLLGGQYASVAHGGLTLFDLFRGATLSVMLFSAIGFAMPSDTDDGAAVALHHPLVHSRTTASSRQFETVHDALVSDAKHSLGESDGPH